MTFVSLKMHGDTAVLSVDNPPVNALSLGVRDGLLNQVIAADEDKDVRAIVITCVGRTFIAGADIKEFGKSEEKPYLQEVVSRIEACHTPIIAAIHGTALGGGLEVALACHYRIGVSSSFVGLPEVHLGLLPGASGTQRLPRLIGPAKALDVMLTGKPIPASIAHEMGVLDKLASDDTLLSDALSFAVVCVAEGPRRICDIFVPEHSDELFAKTRQMIAKKTRGQLAPGKIIDCVEVATTTSFEEGLKKERACFMECMASPQSAGLRHAFFAERQVGKVPGITKETLRRPLVSAAVIGAGTMGAGIAYSCLASGMEVTLLDNHDGGLARGFKTVEGLFAGGVERGKISDADRESGLARFSTSQDYADIADVDIVIEAVFESMVIKKQVFAALDATIKQGAILATNTSTLSIDEIASATSRPQDVIGLHFFSPAHIMRLLEIVRGEATADDVIASSLALAKRLKKVGVVVGNCNGFVGNRMLYNFGRENQFLLLEGAAPEFIDKTMVDWGMAMGPNAVGDLAGLDVGYKVRQERDDLPEDPAFYRIADMLAEMGRFGQKTGKGMYLYEQGTHTPTPDPEVAAMISGEAARLGIEQRDIDADEIIERCIYGLIVEGTRILEEGIALRSSDIDVVWMNGYGFPAYRGGPMHYADSIGLDKVYATVRQLQERFGVTFWEPPRLLKELAESGRKFSSLI
jgi:3-hydroxyacyl-CoA dehydrogenase